MAERWGERDRPDYRDDREYRGREGRDRGMFERAADEFRSWVGDDEAARRRRMDELHEERHGRSSSSRGTGERAWEGARETMGDVTDRDRDGRTGIAEWNDADRPWDRSRAATYSRSAGRERTEPWSSTRDRGDYWTRERSFGDTSRYSTADRYGSPTWGSAWAGSDRGWHESYAGRGPRGYKRGDARIHEDVCDWLTDDPRIDASDIEVQVKDGEVTLAGSVRTREEKRYTEDVVERITGVREVNNNLKVRRTDEVLGTSRSGASTLGLDETPPAKSR